MRVVRRLGASPLELVVQQLGRVDLGPRPQPKRPGREPAPPALVAEPTDELALLRAEGHAALLLRLAEDDPQPAVRAVAPLLLPERAQQPPGRAPPLVPQVQQLGDRVERGRAQPAREALRTPEVAERWYAVLVDCKERAQAAAADPPVG